MIAVVVTFRVRAGQMVRFVPLIADNAKRSVEVEAACHRFDLWTDPQRPGEVFLYELYEDRAGFQAHLDSAHFQAFESATADMVADKQVRIYESAVA